SQATVPPHTLPYRQPFTGFFRTHRGAPHENAARRAKTQARGCYRLFTKSEVRTAYNDSLCYAGGSFSLRMHLMLVHFRSCLCVRMAVGCLLWAALGGAAANKSPADDSTAPGRLSLSTRRIIAFKDGYCLIVKDAEGSTD